MFGFARLPSPQSRLAEPLLWNEVSTNAETNTQEGKRSTRPITGKDVSFALRLASEHTALQGKLHQEPPPRSALTGVRLRGSTRHTRRRRCAEVVIGDARDT